MNHLSCIPCKGCPTCKDRLAYTGSLSCLSCVTCEGRHDCTGLPGPDGPVRRGTLGQERRCRALCATPIAVMCAGRRLVIAGGCARAPSGNTALGNIAAQLQCGVPVSIRARCTTLSAGRRSRSRTRERLVALKVEGKRQKKYISPHIGRLACPSCTGRTESTESPRHFSPVSRWSVKCRV